MACFELSCELNFDLGLILSVQKCGEAAVNFVLQLQSELLASELCLGSAVRPRGTAFGKPDARLAFLIFFVGELVFGLTLGLLVGMALKGLVSLIGVLGKSFIALFSLRESPKNPKSRRFRRKCIPKSPHLRMKLKLGRTAAWKKVELPMRVVVVGKGLNRVEGHEVKVVPKVEGRGEPGFARKRRAELSASALSCCFGRDLACCVTGDDENVQDRKVVQLRALRGSEPRAPASTRGLPVPGAEPLEPDSPEMIPDEPVAPESPAKSRKKIGPEPESSKPPAPPDPPSGEVHEEPRIPLQSIALRVHQAHGHSPFDRNCCSCVGSRGRVPARRLRRKLQKEDQTIGLDFMYFGRLRVLLAVHLYSHYVLAIPAVELHERTLEYNFNRFIRELGLNGKTITIRCDNEPSMLATAERLAAQSTVARSVIDPSPGYRPQAKGGIERMVSVVKQAFWSIWLDLEDELSKTQPESEPIRLPLGGMLWQTALLYTCRTYNLWHSSLNDVTTPIDRVHEQIVHRTRTFAFGSLVYAKTSKSKAHLDRFRGKSLVKCVYLGPVHPRGGGVFAALSVDGQPQTEIDVFPACRQVSDEPTYDRESVLALARFNPLGPDEDPERPRLLEPLEPPVDQGPEDPQALEEPELLPDEDIPMPDAEEMYSPSHGAPEPVEDMELTDMLIGNMVEDSLLALGRGPDLLCATKTKTREGVSFELPFGGTKVRCEVPANAISETSGELLSPELLEKSMRLELEELESFKVGVSVPEKKARAEAKESGRRVLSCRWVNTVKKPGMYRSRLVVRDFASMGGTTLAEGIYSPTTTLEGLRLLLSMCCKRGTMLSCDVSVAFMHATIARPEFVQMPTNITSLSGERIFLKLFRAMNGLRSAPLSWYKELSSFLTSQGFAQILDPTIFRKRGKRGLVVVLFYVDDLLIWSEDPRDAEDVYELLAKRYKLKLTGRLPEGGPGELTFLGRRIFRRHWGDNSLFFGLEESYLKACWQEFGIDKATIKLPSLERRMADLLKREGPNTEKLSPAAHERYRRVLGRLAWASLSRPDIQFCTGFLGRFQSSPDGAAESVMRDVLRWLKALPHKVQQFPTERSLLYDDNDDESVTLFVDASWSLNSTSGGVVTWANSCLKTFSRKQSTVALSSAEAELAALTEVAKEGLFIALLVQTLREGVPQDTEEGRYLLSAFSDSESALSIAAMPTLLRRVRHIELRAAWLQQLVAKERLVLAHIPGTMNPADALTKSPTPENLVSLYEACGLVDEPLETSKAQQLEEASVEVPETSVLSSPETKHVSFELENEPNNEHLDTEGPPLQIPLEWMADALRVSEGKVKMVVLELCCEARSALCLACLRRSEEVAYFGVTKKVDLLSRNTFRLILEILKTLKYYPEVGIYVHLSTPCTAGCGFRHINSRRQGFLKYWRSQLRVHKMSWRRIRSLFSPFVGAEKLLLLHEWPKRSSLWYESTFRSAAKALKLDHGCVVDRCLFDGVFKRWWFCSNSRALIWELSAFSCNHPKTHQHRKIALKETGVYPAKLGSTLLSKTGNLLRKARTPKAGLPVHEGV